MTRTRNPVSALIDRFTPTVAREFRLARAQVRKCFPRGYELVYDSYNAFGCGYSTTSRNSGILVSVVAYPRWVTLFFFHGKTLTDPEGVLQGSGARIRSVRLIPVSRVKSAAVDALLAQAIAPFKAQLAAAPKLSTTVKAVATHQRPRRPLKQPRRKTVAASAGSPSRGARLPRWARG